MTPSASPAPAESPASATLPRSSAKRRESRARVLESGGKNVARREAVGGDEDLETLRREGRGDRPIGFGRTREEGAAVEIKQRRSGAADLCRHAAETLALEAALGNLIGKLEREGPRRLAERLRIGQSRLHAATQEAAGKRRRDGSQMSRPSTSTRSRCTVRRRLSSFGASASARR